LNQGLIAAGLGMLAGSRGKSFGEALGQGGLLGFQAMNEERTRQQKDPAQQIALANSVIGLQQNLQNMRAMKDWQGQLNGVPAPTPQYGMQDRSGGEMPTQEQALATQLGPDMLQKGMMSPNAAVATQAKNLYETFFAVRTRLASSATRWGRMVRKCRRPTLTRPSLSCRTVNSALLRGSARRWRQ
jgi:hypothetical protein